MTSALFMPFAELIPVLVSSLVMRARCDRSTFSSTDQSISISWKYDSMPRCLRVSYSTNFHFMSLIKSSYFFITKKPSPLQIAITWSILKAQGDTFIPTNRAFWNFSRSSLYHACVTSFNRYDVRGSFIARNLCFSLTYIYLALRIHAMRMRHSGTLLRSRDI